MNETDLELLRRYGSDHSEEAFGEIVRRHLNLVYAAALRQVRSPELAEEISQSVFTDLARHAHRLAPDTVLAAWLYEVTHRTAIDVFRREARRRLREQAASEMHAMNDPASPWMPIEPLLDEAMQALDGPERAAILLRYFENKSLREVGQTLGTSEMAAQKRVSRAVEHLREFFARRGVSVGASGLAALLSAHAAQAAPVGLAVTISSTAALAGAALPPATAVTATQTIAMSTLQKSIIAATLAAALGTALFETRSISRLRHHVQRLQEQQAAQAGELDRLTRERDTALARQAALQQENEQLRATSAELPKLRGDAARLRAEAQELARLKTTDAGDLNDPVASAAKSWIARTHRLQELVAQRPETSIPEFQFLTEEDWLKAALKLETDPDGRKALSELRRAAENRFIKLMQPALRQYLQANNSQWPTDLAQLQPHFPSPLDERVLQRWKVAPADAVPNVRVGGDWMVTQRSVIDEENDLQVVVGPTGSGSTNFKKNTAQGSGASNR